MGPVWQHLSRMPTLVPCKTCNNVSRFMDRGEGSAEITCLILTWSMKTPIQSNGRHDPLNLPTSDCHNRCLWMTYNHQILGIKVITYHLWIISRATGNRDQTTTIQKLKMNTGLQISKNSIITRMNLTTYSTEITINKVHFSMMKSNNFMTTFQSKLLGVQYNRFNHQERRLSPHCHESITVRLYWIMAITSSYQIIKAFQFRIKINLICL